MEPVVGWPAPNPTGAFFDNQTPEALEKAIKLFESHDTEFKPEPCRRNAERFERKHPKGSYSGSTHWS